MARCLINLCLVPFSASPICSYVNLTLKVFEVEHLKQELLSRFYMQSTAGCCASACGGELLLQLGTVFERAFKSI